MARMHDVIQKLYIRGGTVPEEWEAYFIASLHKYSFRERNKQRFAQNWYREHNFWLNLDLAGMNSMLLAAKQIVEDEALYQWSGFVRYLIYDTIIVRENEKILEQLIPALYMGKSSALFIAVTMVSNIDQSVQGYKDKKLEEGQIKRNFSIVAGLMNAHKNRIGYYGTPTTVFLPRLAWSSLYVFEGLGFEFKSRDLPGKVYKNNRSGEVLMVADEGKLYDEEGHRLNTSEEVALLSQLAKSKLMVEESSVEDAGDQNPDKLKTSSILPNGIWETKRFTTDSGGFIGNVFEKNGKARNTVRIFDSGQWKEIVNDDTPILELFIPDERELTREQFRVAVEQAFRQLHVDGQESVALFWDSFLLDPMLPKYLENSQEIEEVISLFRLFSLPDDRDQVLQYVFPNAFKSANIKDWPAMNPIQEGIKKMALDGQWIRSFGGFIMLEDLNINKPREEE